MDHVRDYVTLSDCYDVFNGWLFGGALRGCVLTFEDRGQHFGYYREGGFIGHAGERRDENRGFGGRLPLRDRAGSFRGAAQAMGGESRTGWETGWMAAAFLPMV